MPASHYTNKGLFTKVCQAYPGTPRILDVCSGWGEFGPLAKEHGARIEGVEIFPRYIEDKPENYGVYDSVHIGDALDILPRLGAFDIVLVLGSLEHFEDDDGHRLLRLCADRGTTTLLVTPKVPGRHGAKHGNKYEAHVSDWTLEKAMNGYAHLDLSDRERVRCVYGHERKEWWNTI